MGETRTADCGHEYVQQERGGTGYATDNKTGRTMCYPCSDARELEDMRTADKYMGYLSSDAKTVTTWPGGKLGTVTGLYWRDGCTPTGGKYRRAHFSMRDVHGQQWHGSSPGGGMYARLRRVKVKAD